MTSKERVSKAQDIALEERGFDYIEDVHDADGYVEVIGVMGGEREPYRVYDEDLNNDAR